MSDDYDEPRDEALEARIALDPSVENYRVYSDWLLQHDNPRGELIAVQTAMESATGPEWGKLKLRELELLKAHAGQLYGPLKKWKAARRTELVWQRGFIKTVLGHSFREVTMELFAHPSSRFLDSCLVADGDEVSAHPEQPFRELSVLGDKLSAPLALAKLRSLKLFITRWERELSHPGLESLHWARPSTSQWEALAKSSLPALKRLAIKVPPEATPIACEWLSRQRLESVRVEVEGVQRASSTRPIDHLSLAGCPAAEVAALPQAWLDGASKLDLIAPGSPERDTYFQQLPKLPNVRTVRLTFPSDLVGWFRSFAQGALAAQVEQLELGVAKPNAGAAIASGGYPKLRALSLRFDRSLSPAFLESEKLFAAESWAPVKSLWLDPPGHLVALARSPLGERLEELTLLPDTDREGELLLEHVAKLKSLKVLRIRGERLENPAVITRLCALPLTVEWLGNATGSLVS